MMGIRKPVASGKHSRPRSPKEQRERILIVCGSEQSEPNYLTDLLDFHGVNTASVDIVRVAYTPGAVVRKAKQLHANEKKQGEKYDEVYCVFDTDDFPCLNDAVQSAKHVGFICIVSSPCFEYWLLVHFRQTDAPYAATPRKTVGELCLHDLKQEMAAYQKNGRGLYRELFPRLPAAIKYATRKYREAAQAREFNPSTNFYILVEKLQTLKTLN